MEETGIEPKQEMGDLHYRRVANRLRADIFEGLWRPDARLKVSDLAKHYGVSPAPVRESLQMLQGEGLLLIEPNRGARLRPIDETLILNIYDVREALESFLAGKFAASASSHQIEMIEVLQSQYETAVRAEDATSAASLNERFHLLINGAARNAEALVVIDRHLGLIRALRRETGLSVPRMQVVQREHRMLIAAFKAGDMAGAARIAGMHVRSARDDLVERLAPMLARR
jgi:DNA-binding GntR family transcriptional regulator